MEIDPELSAYIRTHRSDDVRQLALSDQKRLGDSLNYVLNQIGGWQKAKEKIPSWSEIDGIVYPPHLSMEQCSSERTAAYKATLVQGDTFTDLTGKIRQPVLPCGRLRLRRPCRAAGVFLCSESVIC